MRVKPAGKASFFSAGCSLDPNWLRQSVAFNGLFVGAAAGHLTALRYGRIFWPLVSGHTALELTAIAIAGAAGLLLAAALMAPGRRPRQEGLRANAREALTLVMGALGDAGAGRTGVGLLICR